MGEVVSWRRRISATGLGTIRSFIGDYLNRLESEFGVHLRSLNRSPATIYRYWLAASQLDDFLLANDLSTDVAEIKRADVEKFIAASFESAAATTVQGRYQALQQFFGFVGIAVSPTPYTSPMNDMKPPAVEDPMIEPAPAWVIKGMLAQVEGGRHGKTFEEIRDAAIIRMFIDTGARCAEITGIKTPEDLLAGNIVRLWGKSKGGGPVERHVPYGEKTTQALRRYLRAREHHPYKSDSLWLGLRGPMTTSGIRQMIWKRSARAGLRIHPHQFRHTFAHNWKRDERRKDGDLKYIAGWRTDAMLDRYGKSAAADRAIENYRSLGSPMEDM